MRVALAAIVLVTLGCGSSETTPPADGSVAETGADSSIMESGGGDSGGAPDLGADATDAVVDMGPDTRGEPPVVHAIAGVTVDTLAGSGTSGSAEGTGAAAQFNNPVGIAFDATGTLVVTEYDGGRVRRVTTAGVTSLVAGGILEPFGVTTTATAIYFQTAANKAGMKTATSGTIWRIAGSAAPEEVVTGFARPRGIVSLADGRLVIADRMNHTVSLLDPATKAVTPIAGAPTAGFADGTGAAARFNGPYGVAVLPDGSVVLADEGNHCIRRVTLAGVVTLFAGDRNPGMKDDSDKLAARFDGPTAVAADGSGNVYVADQGNHRIRRISAAGAVETVAGDGSRGFADGAGSSAQFFGQEGVAAASDGKTLYVTDGHFGDGGPYHRVRRIKLP